MNKHTDDWNEAVNNLCKLQKNLQEQLQLWSLKPFCKTQDALIHWESSVWSLLDSAKAKDSNTFLGTCLEYKLNNKTLSKCFFRNTDLYEKNLIFWSSITSIVLKIYEKKLS